jgi:hypothetical protein
MCGCQGGLFILLLLEDQVLLSHPLRPRKSAAVADAPLQLELRCAFGIKEPISRSYAGQLLHPFRSKQKVNSAREKDRYESVTADH